MRELPKTSAVGAALMVFLSIGCQASVEGAKAGSGGTDGAAGNQNLGGGVELPQGTEPAALLPARIRRLTVAEYQASVSDTIGSAADAVSVDFVPDSRQSGFTVNEAQRVDPVFARQLAEASLKLAADVRGRVGELAPCANPAGGAEACAESFIRSFGQRIFRRPVGDDEVAQLLLVFRAAFDGGSYDEGIELVVRGMLQSAAFLYLTEIGDTPAATVKLTPYELASSISYLIQGHPPSAELIDQALRGELDMPGSRATITSTLFDPRARDRVVRVVREWLGTDRILETAKDTNVYEEFAGVRGAMDRETAEFLQVLVTEEGAALSKLLSADWTVVNEPLARIYGSSAGSADTFERISTPNRLGILNQGAFLSVFAHADGTAPVLRGVALMRRLACIDLPNPIDLNISVVPPAPDLTKSTRERFSIHATDPKCATCHKQIDNFGFAFEQFDGMGELRTEDGMHAVDSSSVITGTDFDGSYANSNELVSAMAHSPQVRDCFARHVFRALAATSAPELRASEDGFVKHWETTLERDASNQVVDVNIINTLVSYVSDPAFAYRRAQ
jgi:hypothetical protein